MGTRNLTVIVKDNKIKLSQYGQWDGYFSYTGVEFLKFVKENLQDKDNDRYAYQIKKFGEIADILEDCEKNCFDNFIKLSEEYGVENRKNTTKYGIPLGIMFPQFSRDTGVKILDVIQKLEPYNFSKWDTDENGNNIRVNVQKFPVKFVLDGSFIEYMNVIDLDSEEIYMFTSHSFSKEKNGIEHHITYPTILKQYGLDCYYKCKIQKLPSITKISKYVKEIKLED